MQNQQIYEEASEWFVRMRDADDAPGVRAEFMEWLRRSPEHVSAYLDIAAVWMEAKGSEVDDDLGLDARIELAKADKSVAELTPRAGAGVARALSHRKWFALAASVLLVAVGASAAWWKLWGSTYSTDLGEQRSIALRDGSTINLNSESQVRVRFDEARRTIELVKGQALFSVAKDAARPFVVQADGTAVRAVGTVFDVYRKQGGAIVTVVEGAVDVQRAPRWKAEGPATEATARSATPTSGGTAQPRPARTSAPVRLVAGEQLVIGANVAPSAKPVNISTATAWTRRELAFEFTPLSEVADEFNRYNERRLIVEGEWLRSFKISAVFRSTDSGSLVRYLQNMPGVRIREGEDRIVIAAEPN